ncbi:TetR/AcrR family transcriptional regulator [Nonomuraea sp. NPDC046802]|uniref:TetR/AcrR family transcriptional regulator n=1 Tax=Nonomuraea sp. NPDC046802 TaxID=3154919 RepID=UPI00340627AA
MTQPVGRPRDGRVDGAIAAAARELLAEHGYAQLTVDAVASRAGVGKAAIYRRHATKQAMIFAAVMHDLELATPPDAGSLAADLAAVTHVIVSSLSAPPPGVVPGLLADVHADAGMAEAFAGTFIKAERDCVTEVLDRAVGRGELARRPDPAAVHAMLLGPIFAWLFLLVEEPERLPGFAADLATGLARLLTSDTAAHQPFG